MLQLLPLDLLQCKHVLTVFTAFQITHFPSRCVKNYTIMYDGNRIVVMLEKTGTLKIASVGDCGLKVIRKGDYE